MKEQTRKYRVASGGTYVQVRHFDDTGSFVGEYWERLCGDESSSLTTAAYVSPRMCTRIANNYVRYQQAGRFNKYLLRKLVIMGKREHYKGSDGRIVYISRTTTIYSSSRVVEIKPEFEPDASASQTFVPSDIADQINASS